MAMYSAESLNSSHTIINKKRKEPFTRGEGGQTKKPLKKPLSTKIPLKRLRTPHKMIKYSIKMHINTGKNTIKNAVKRYEPLRLKGHWFTRTEEKQGLVHRKAGSVGFEPTISGSADQNHILTRLRAQPINARNL